MSPPHNCDQDRSVTSKAASAELDLTLPIAILSTVTVLLILALCILVRTIKQSNKRVANRVGRMMTGIENDVKLYEDHEDCAKYIANGSFVSSSVLI